jgi:hypothetical protein
MLFPKPLTSHQKIELRYAQHYSRCVAKHCSVQWEIFLCSSMEQAKPVKVNRSCRAAFDEDNPNAEMLNLRHTRDKALQLLGFGGMSRNPGFAGCELPSFFRLPEGASYAASSF